ncbi:MAG: hypothetical protein NVSMB26_02150 [Beijerinckiaceae bacterium]
MRSLDPFEALIVPPPDHVPAMAAKPSSAAAKRCAKAAELSAKMAVAKTLVASILKLASRTAKRNMHLSFDLRVKLVSSCRRGNGNAKLLLRNRCRA